VVYLWCTCVFVSSVWVWCKCVWNMCVGGYMCVYVLYVSVVCGAVQHRMLKTVLETITTSVGGNSYKKVRLRMTQGQVVIFPTERVNLEEYGLKIHYKVDSDIHESYLDLPVCWRLYVDDAPPKEGQFLLRDIQNF